MIAMKKPYKVVIVIEATVTGLRVVGVAGSTARASNLTDVKHDVRDVLDCAGIVVDQVTAMKIQTPKVEKPAK